MMKGEDGGYYTPSVDENGNLTWIPSEEGMEVPAAANIQGPVGETGAKGASGVYVGSEEPTDAEMLVWINPDGTESGELATKQYVDEAIAAIDAPEVDMSNYYNKSEVDALIPSTSGFITMEDVEGKGYQTEEQVNTLINTALGVIENGTY